jgi:hypothetical protein
LTSTLFSSLDGARKNNTNDVFSPFASDSDYFPPTCSTFECGMMLIAPLQPPGPQLRPAARCCPRPCPPQDQPWPEASPHGSHQEAP